MPCDPHCRERDPKGRATQGNPAKLAGGHDARAHDESSVATSLTLNAKRKTNSEIAAMRLPSRLRRQAAQEPSRARAATAIAPQAGECRAMGAVTLGPLACQLTQLLQRRRLLALPSELTTH